MTTNQTRAHENKSVSLTWGGKIWIAVPLLLLVVSVSGWLYMVAIAVDDPGFSVEKDYYKKAANYDQHIEQRTESARLGWGAAVQSFVRQEDKSAHLTIQLVNEQGVALDGVKVTVEAFPIARGGEIHSLALSQVEPGIFVGAISDARAGMWEVRVTAISETSARPQRFNASLRAELFAPPPESPPS